MKDTLIAIGEALIDFIPAEAGAPIRQVSGFLPAVGGAPANVCGAFTKLGGKSSMITQLGEDPFGDKIVEMFQENHIDCSHVLRTKEANTSLAFVALQEDGSREFSFFRNPGADMLYSRESLEKSWFESCYAFHFCSVSLGEFPMKDAHKQAISYAKEAGSIISFDPNLRPMLWDSEAAMINAVREFITFANVLKVSDEELELITGVADETKALEKLLTNDVKLILYTKGSNGAQAITKNYKVEVPGLGANAVDTTGAGDGFIGSFLYYLYQNNISLEELEDLTKEQLEKGLNFSNRFCSMSVQKKGAILSYPTMEEMNA